MLVDDHAVVRMGFRMLLSDTEHIEVIAEADDGETALRQCAEQQPDVLVMDLSMPGMGGLEAISRLNAKIRSCAFWCCRRTRTRCTPSGR